jgi:hypothetical protein
LVLRDELTGWLAELDRAGRERERAFYLTAWNGDTGHTVDRIKRGTVYVPACRLSLLGGIQPDQLAAYLVTGHLRLQDDGLIQRFQLMVWPDVNTDWDYVDRTPNAAALTIVEEVYQRLVALSTGSPLRFRLSRDAQELFVTHSECLEGRLRRDDLPLILKSHLSKYRSLMPSLALLFELADRAGGGFDGFEGGRVL